MRFTGFSVMRAKLEREKPMAGMGKKPGEIIGIQMKMFVWKLRAPGQEVYYF